MSDESVIAEAERIINGPRQSNYGHPLDDFTKTAAFWSTLLTARHGAPVTVTAEDVALMMVLLKVSRELHHHNRDNLVDVAGYIGTLEKVVDERARRDDAP